MELKLEKILCECGRLVHYLTLSTKRFYFVIGIHKKGIVTEEKRPAFYI